MIRLPPEPIIFRLAFPAQALDGESCPQGICNQHGHNCPAQLHTPAHRKQPSRHSRHSTGWRRGCIKAKKTSVLPVCDKPHTQCSRQQHHIRSSRPRQPSCRRVARGPGVGCPGGLRRTALHMLLPGANVWLACTTGCLYGNNPHVYPSRSRHDDHIDISQTQGLSRGLCCSAVRRGVPPGIGIPPAAAAVQHLRVRQRLQRQRLQRLRVRQQPLHLAQPFLPQATPRAAAVQLPPRGRAC